MPLADRQWIGQIVFVANGKLSGKLKHWWYPPETVVSNAQPQAEAYVLRKFYLWMPRKMLRVDLRCPNCQHRSLASKGLYNRVRLVMDLSAFYYLAAEYMHCADCSRTIIAWDSRILEQLSDGIIAHFPAVLTHKYACDKAVIALLRSRTLGNTPTALHNKLLEMHTEAWARAQLSYLSDCELHDKSRKRLCPSDEQKYAEPVPLRSVPGPKWFLACYVRDVYSRLAELKAAITSVFGSILKMDATMAVCKKLQGAVKDMASCAVSVCNEHGQVLNSVVTVSEEQDCLQKLADGLVSRYAAAGVNPPLLLYVDRDCCCQSGACKPAILFKQWRSLQVKLDIFHFMRRFARGCCSESHPLYGFFMSRLSQCIFEWDTEDFKLLIEAKKGQLEKEGVQNIGDSAIIKLLTKEELARHCRRRTRGTDETRQLIEALILSLADATDMLGVHLFNNEMGEIWKEQKKHLSCIQDSPNIPLYTVCGTLQKGGIKLPVYKCARGTNSQESFHLHLARFIPGSSANGLNFQVYLLDGLTQWNELRRCAAASKSNSSQRCFNVRLCHLLNSKSLAIHGKTLLNTSPLPAAYTGELIGVEYLFDQKGDALPTSVDEVEAKIDEGFQDFSVEEEEVSETFSVPTDADAIPVLTPAEEAKDDEASIYTEKQISQARVFYFFRVFFR